MAKIRYYGDKLSPNIAKTPEGFIICQNVPIARTGYQKYYGSEIGDNDNPDDIVNVYRPADEVFAPATLASFEGKPVTNGHPDVDVTPDNYRTLAAGHVQNVRAGTGADSNKILADLYITDPTLIGDVMDGGKRQISAGYYAEEMQDEQGRVCQTQIRGNHVAVVDRGRAGASVCIRDEKLGANAMKKAKAKNSRKALARVMAAYIRDAAPEELDDRMEDVEAIMDGDEPIEDEDELQEDCDEIKDEDEIQEDEDPIEDEDELQEDEDELPVEDEDEIIQDDADTIAEIKEAISGLNALLRRLGGESVMDDDPAIEDEDEIDESEVDEVSIIPTDELEEDEDEVGAESIKDAVLKIKNPRDRARVQDALIRARNKGKKNQMAGLMKVVQSNQRKRNDSLNIKSISIAKQQSAYDALNPHKGDK